MSWIDPLKKLLRPVDVRQAEPKPQPEEPASVPLGFGILAQSARILKRAHIYRQQIQREAEARARHEREREQRDLEARQLGWEDAVARSLAARWSHFPGDGDEAREPGPLVSFEAWGAQRQDDYWERGRE